MFSNFNQPQCPRCGCKDIYRVGRRGTIARILSKFAIYRYKCNNFYKLGKKLLSSKQNQKIVVAYPQYVGINVSKTTLEVYILPLGKSLKAANTALEIARLVDKIRHYNLNTIVVEETKGLEKEIIIQLQAAFLPVAIVDRRQGIYFAKAMGKSPKTRAINAEILARFGEAIKPEVLTIEPELARALGELLGRRRQLMEMQKAEKNLLACVSGQALEDIKEHINFLDKRLEKLNQEIDLLAQPSQQYLERFNLIKLTNDRHSRNSIA